MPFIIRSALAGVVVARGLLRKEVGEHGHIDRKVRKRHESA
jgi:hypothetical protein